MTCSTPGCGKPVHIKKRGLCRGCYMAWYRNERKPAVPVLPNRRIVEVVEARHARTEGWFMRIIEGETASEIARSEGISRQRVCAMLRQDGYETFLPKVVRNRAVLSPRSRSWVRIMALLDQYIQVGARDVCWPWTGRVEVVNERTEYFMPCNITAFDPLDADTCRATKPYRVVYLINKGPIPEGMTVDHLCFNPLCCNPDHLQLLTRSGNASRRNPERVARNRERRAS